MSSVFAANNFGNPIAVCIHCTQKWKRVCEWLQIEVLQQVGCIDPELVVQVKGRVACELNSCDELIATECLFDNQLGDLSPVEAVSLLSALVFQQKDASEPLLTPRLEEARDRY
jgi:antiviral helicase SKI2